MLDIPIWLEEHINEYACPSCDVPLQRTSITAIGIRELKKNGEDGYEYYFFIEHNCEKCGKIFAINLLKNTVKDLVYDMFDKYSKETVDGETGADIKKENNEKKIIKHVQKSGISLDEMKEMKDVLDKAETKEDIMKVFGIDKDSNIDNSGDISFEGK